MERHRDREGETEWKKVVDSGVERWKVGRGGER